MYCGFVEGMLDKLPVCSTKVSSYTYIEMKGINCGTPHDKKFIIKKKQQPLTNSQKPFQLIFFKNLSQQLLLPGKLKKKTIIITEQKFY